MDGLQGLGLAMLVSVVVCRQTASRRRAKKEQTRIERDTNSTFPEHTDDVHTLQISNHGTRHISHFINQISNIGRTFFCFFLAICYRLGHVYLLRCMDPKIEKVNRPLPDDDMPIRLQFALSIVKS
jgi:hypothetical protein